MQIAGHHLSELLDRADLCTTQTYILKQKRSQHNTEEEFLKTIVAAC